MISYIVALTSVNLDEPAEPPFTIETPNGVHRIFKRLAKALTRMRVFAGGSEPLACRTHQIVRNLMSRLIYHISMVWKVLE